MDITVGALDPYPQGLSRGDTPPHDIPTTGAGGKRNPADIRRAEESKGRPYQYDECLRFPARSDGMSLGVLDPSDVPPGPLRFTKDFCLSLTTSDIPRAQPMLAHSSAGTGLPVPWKLLNMPEKPAIPKSIGKTHYPYLHSSRPRDLSLTSRDIDKAYPKKIGGNSEGKGRTDRTVDPLDPVYAHLSSEAPPQPTPRWNRGRCTLDMADVEMSQPKHAPNLPATARRGFGDTLRLEEEFQSKTRSRAIQAVMEQMQPVDLQSRVGEGDAAAASSASLQNQYAVRKPPFRSTDPVDPQYRVNLALDGAGTSLHARWGEEKGSLGHALPAVHTQDIGRIWGSTPRTKIRDNGQPQMSLDARDIEGATSMTKVGAVPHSIYGPEGRRPGHNLNTSDIQGAQASTLRRGPKMVTRAAVPGAGAS